MSNKTKKESVVQVSDSVCGQYVTYTNRGLEWVELTENLFGVVRSGSKTIHYAGDVDTIHAGEVFFLPSGRHYIQNYPQAGDPYVEETFRFDNSAMEKAMSVLVMLYQIDVRRPPVERRLKLMPHASTPLWHEMELFFESLKPYQEDSGLTLESNLMRLKLAELAYLVFVHNDHNLQQKLMQSVERISDPFENIVRASIFENLTINELAKRTNKSLTSFKTDFMRIFGQTPHRWIIQQRLLHAQLLVISTNKAISQIGYECRFDNISHFIKLFKREFGQTPLTMRQKSNNR